MIDTHDQALPQVEVPHAPDVPPTERPPEGPVGPDLRSELQKQDEAAAAAFAALPKADKVRTLIGEALAEIDLQAKHNAPMTDSVRLKLEAVLALVSESKAPDEATPPIEK